MTFNIKHSIICDRRNICCQSVAAAERSRGYSSRRMKVRGVKTVRISIRTSHHTISKWNTDADFLWTAWSDIDVTCQTNFVACDMTDKFSRRVWCEQFE